VKDLRVNIVIPYHNEEESLAVSCASLGFGLGKDCPDNSALILVDNGSTDRSSTVAKAIAVASPPGSVYLVHESERGFVPPRRRGNVEAAQLASNLGFLPSQILILQCDADTTYGGKYVDDMRNAAEREGRSILLQALTGYPIGFCNSYPRYGAYCAVVDSKVEELLQDHPDQIVVDDKAVGYLLEDYILWGGHRREFFSGGDEIDAETTRLFMRARVHGCRLVPVESARAEHSVRKLLSEPAMDLATAGFPRGGSWRQSWIERTSPIGGMGRFLAYATDDLIEEALDLRRRHTLALFGLLPVHVARALDMRSCVEAHPDISSITLPNRNIETLKSNPAIFIEDVLRACALLSA